MKSNYKIIDKNNVEYELYVTTDYEISTNNAIIIFESATGDGGYTLHNGRLQESIPINGVIYANDLNELKFKLNQLLLLSTKGEVITFVGAVLNLNRSNKFYIQNFKYTIAAGNYNHASFSCTLTEYREANVKQISTNLVSYDTAKLLNELYNQRIGNI